MSVSVSRSSLRHALTLTADSSGGAQRHALHIDGVRERAVSGECFASINPATGARGAEFAEAGADDVGDAVAAAARAFASPPWGALSRLAGAGC